MFAIHLRMIRFTYHLCKAAISFSYCSWHPHYLCFLVCSSESCLKFVSCRTIAFMPLRSLEFCSDPEGCQCPQRTFTAATFAEEISQALCCDCLSTLLVNLAKKATSAASASSTNLQGLSMNLALLVSTFLRLFMVELREPINFGCVSEGLRFYLIKMIFSCLPLPRVIDFCPFENHFCR